MASTDRGVSAVAREHAYAPSGRMSSAAVRQTILLIESHEDTRDLYAEFLETCGFAVVAAENTDAVMPHVEAAAAVVTALEVHGSMDGVGLIRRIRASSSANAVPVIVVTSHAYEWQRAEALAAGADLFLAKPCPPDLLASELRRLLAPQ